MAVLAFALAWAPPAAGQAVAPSNGSNTGSLTFIGGVDAPTSYFFRGIRQEGEPKITLWPYGTLRIALKSGDGALKSVYVDVGVWNSLHTGTSGTGGPAKRLHYEEDFSSTLSLEFAGISLGSSFIAYTSPNDSFRTVKEIDFKLSKAGAIAPYGIVAFEIGGKGTGQADNGLHKGSYLELGAAPNRTFGKLTVAMPVKVGLSLKNYYELVGRAGTTTDHAFGFFDIGGLVTLPISSSASRFGSWNIHGGADVLTFGDTTKAFNQGDKTKVVGVAGIGVSY